MTIRQFRPRITVGRQMGGNDTAASIEANLRAGLKGILDNLYGLVRHLEAEGPEILVEALQPAFDKSQVYCPKKTGALADSGYLHAVGFRGGARAAIGYAAGGAPNYAIIVHELPYQHESPTRSKFLQAAVDEEYNSMLDSIPRLVRQAAGT